MQFVKVENGEMARDFMEYQRVSDLETKLAAYKDALLLAKEALEVAEHWVPVVTPMYDTVKEALAKIEELTKEAK